MKKRYFGTDGIRGPVGGDVMNPVFILTLGRAIGAVLCENTAEKPVVYIGRDTRVSGETLQSELQAGLLTAGCEVVLLGVLPTPAIAYLTKKNHAAAGVVISASHNVYSDNGIKMIGSDGFKLSDAWELAIERCLCRDAINRVSTGRVSTAMQDDVAVTQYIQHCTQLFSSLNLSDKKIVLDCANGATSFVAPTIFNMLGADVILIHANPNGTNINDHCGATNVSDLQQKVLQEKADAGLAFDGDGDRLIMVDHQGERVDCDEILCILAMHTKQKAVVGTLMSNLGLEKAVKARGMQFERAQVGDRYVLAKLQENHWRLGGEGSGHIVNLDYATTGDGILTGLQILQAMQISQQSLYALKQGMKKRPQVLINVPVKDVSQFSMMHELKMAAEQLQIHMGEAGRVLLRASGTESCIRVMVECDDEISARTHAETLASRVIT